MATVEVPARLKRMTLIIPRESNERAMVAQRAADLLGYKGKLISDGIAGKLGKVLVELDIKPFDPSRVAAYKRKQANNMRNQLRQTSYSVSVRWRSTDLRGYTRPVPDFILSKAVQIKEAMPEAHFEVEEMVAQKRRIIDPFLTVEYEGEKYWIEVWDEPEYENSLVDG